MILDEAEQNNIRQEVDNVNLKLIMLIAINTLAKLSGEAASRIIEDMSTTKASLTLRAIKPAV